jgi:hypothetical protein
MWGEDKGLVSSAQSVGTSVLVEVLSADCQNDKVVMRTMIGLTVGVAASPRTLGHILFARRVRRWTPTPF